MMGVVVYTRTGIKAGKGSGGREPSIADVRTNRTVDFQTFCQE